MANKAPQNLTQHSSRPNSLTGFHTKTNPPEFYKVSHANRILIVRNAEKTTTRHNLKSSSFQADWIITHTNELVICFMNRQDLVSFCSTHDPQHFGPHAQFFIPPTATKPAPWLIFKNKLRADDKGLFSASDLDSDSDSDSYTIQRKRTNTKYKTDSLIDKETLSPQPKQTEHTAETSNTEKTCNKTQTTLAALQIAHHTVKSNNPLHIKAITQQLKISLPKTYWSEKTKTTTLVFQTLHDLKIFECQIPPTTFGTHATYNRPSPRNTNSTQTPTREANVVVLGVNPEIDIEDIVSELRETGIEFSRITRIRNSQGNTPLIRIFSNNTETIKTLLTQGLYIANRRYKVVPPKEDNRHTPCRRCQQYGHTQNTCKNDTKCFRCGAINTNCKHNINEARAMHCATCGGSDHYTGQMRCPLYPRETPPPAIPKHTPLITQHRPPSPKKPSDFTTQDFPGLQTDTTTPNTTQKITPATYAATITKTPKTPEPIDIAINILQLQMEDYINKKIEQLENRIIQYIAAVFKSTTTPEHRDNTNTALNSHSKKIFNKSVRTGKFGPSMDVYVTSMQEVQNEFDCKLKELYTQITQKINNITTTGDNG